MKNHFYSLIVLLTISFVFSGGFDLMAQSDDDPNLDRIPDEYLQLLKTHSPRSSTVVTIDGYDNFFLGIDFAEGHISENPNVPGEYFTAFNIDDSHYTMNGHDWEDSNPNWGSFYMRGDPITAYDADGNVYYENMYGQGSIQGCAVVISGDNGQTWGAAKSAISGVDKNWMCADMTDGPYSNYVYTVMTRSGGGNFARTTNQGATWQTTFQPSTQSLPGMMCAVGADGTTNGGAVYVVTNSGSSFSSTYTFYQSLDGGSTFTMKSSQSWAGYVGSNVNGRNSVENMRTRPYPFIAADNSNGPNRGRLYCVYASNSPAGNGNKPDIYCRHSDDGGSTWSSAVTVNDDFPSTGNHQWHPSIWCDYETGRLYVHWMDTRDIITDDSAYIYASYSDNGGQSFVANQRVSNEPMKINCSTCGGGGTPRYQGDYNSIVSNPKTSMSAWADFRDGNFSTYTAYFPDYAMLLEPANAVAVGDVAQLEVIIPSVKLYDDAVIFSGEIEQPAQGSLDITFPNGNSLSSFPDTLLVEVTATGGVPVGFYEITITGRGPNNTPKHIRTAMVEIVPLTPPAADFSASTTTPCMGSGVDFFDESTGSVSEWLWTFEGGTPETSTEENPTGIVFEGSGEYSITLLATNAAGSNSITKDAYIKPLTLPDAPISEDKEVCYGEEVPVLTAEGTMVKWYSDSLLTTLVHAGDTLETGQTEPGEYIYYVTQMPGDCESEGLAVTLTIFESPTVGLMAFEGVCLDAAEFELTGGTPEGGIFSGDGVMDNWFYPVEAGVGEHEITYTYTNEFGCSADSTQVIMVYALPDVSLVEFMGSCINGDAVELAGGMPEGGVFSGEGVMDGMFYPMEAGVGAHEITYTVTDENGCVNFAAQLMTVHDVAYPDLGPDTLLCADLDIMLDASIDNGAVYLWAPGGESSASITVDSSGIGIGSQLFVAAATDINGCITHDSIEVAFKDCTSIGEILGVKDVKVYPNPGEGVFSLMINTDQAVELQVKIYNNRGEEVYSKENLNIFSTYEERIDLRDQAAGIYLMSVSTTKGQWVEKLIIR